ncbi:MAG: VWA domain-containing protein [Oligoflexales bacterium]|nr:VWA domain-containing protein [Oligoflexales bacterium]
MSIIWIRSKQLPFYGKITLAAAVMFFSALAASCGETTGFTDMSYGKKEQPEDKKETADATSAGTNPNADAERSATAPASAATDPSMQTADALPAQPPAEPVQAAPEASPAAAAGPLISKLTWYWKCVLDKDDSNVPVSSDAAAPVFVGEGKHEIPFDMLPDRIPLALDGKLCAPRPAMRDIVFVIDVSGSMNDNDPRRADRGCGRYDAVRTIISKYSNGTNVRFGIVTFDYKIRYQSPAFYSDQASLFDAIVAKQGGEASDVICDYRNTTYYDVALSGAKALLETGRASATKEIYFVSDGLPEGGHEGADIASSLKTTGVSIEGVNVQSTIATILLIGDDGKNEVLEGQIASRDAQGKPLHALVTSASQLADALVSLSETTVRKAVIAVGPSGGALTEYDIMKSSNGTSFSLPPVEIDKASAASGIQVVYTFWDSFGFKYSYSGTISFVTGK